MVILPFKLAYSIVAEHTSQTTPSARYFGNLDPFFAAVDKSQYSSLSILLTNFNSRNFSPHTFAPALDLPLDLPLDLLLPAYSVHFIVVSLISN